MFAPIAVVFVVGILGWACSALKPPRPKICGSPDGFPITSPRVKLSDGRHLAYREVGVHKEQAKHKVIIVHGTNDSKDVNLPISQVPTLSVLHCKSPASAIAKLRCFS